MERMVSVQDSNNPTPDFIFKDFFFSFFFESQQILGWPKGSFGFFRKMALVALSCL